MRGEALAQPPQHVFLMNNQGSDNENEAGPAKKAARRAPANTARYPPFVNWPVYRGIRTTTHTYAVADTGRWILYDNIADPYQMKNLIEDPAQQDLIGHLDRLIEAWLKQADDPFPYAETKTRIARFTSEGLPDRGPSANG